MSWLQIRIQRKESPVGQNKQYAAEVIAILLQSSTKNRKRFIGLDGVDILLQVLSLYRKRDPAKDTEEEEYVENLFDCLTCVVDEDEGKEKFLDGEGIELCQIMLREGKMSKPRALRVLDHALGGAGGAVACDKFVEAAGLKTVFGMFMKKQEKEVIEHLLGIFASLIRLLPGGSAARIRTMAKFVEKDYEKIDKLITLRRDYATRVTSVDQTIRDEKAALTAEDQEDLAAEWLSRRFDAGLFSLQVKSLHTGLLLDLLNITTYRPSISSSLGSLLKMTGPARRYDQRLLIEMRLSLLSKPRCKVRRICSSASLMIRANFNRRATRRVGGGQ